MKTTQTLFIGLVCFFSFAQTGFTVPPGFTPVQEVTTSPAHFDDKEIILRGTTKNPTHIPVIELKAYVLKDESGEITILTSNALPPLDVEITVRVRVENLAIIQGEAIGTTVIELKRYE
ncbi:MAG: hypothetical protein KDF59_14360 [Nitrosomonas sp.]|nr:hypothetical protein [Nitrosomonas sp.]